MIEQFHCPECKSEEFEEQYYITCEDCGFEFLGTEGDECPECGGFETWEELKNIYKIGECNYCGRENVLIRPTPFVADTPAMMCKTCWNMTGAYIPRFEDGPGYKKARLKIKAQSVDKINASECIVCGKEIPINHTQFFTPYGSAHLACEGGLKKIIRQKRREDKRNIKT